MNRRETGARYEEEAVRALYARGYRILERNFRCRFGEIDIIARHGGLLVFIEVKYRGGGGNGLPQEAVTRGKQRTICRTADYYRMSHGYGEDTSCRFDVVAILGEEITLYQNAFPYTGGQDRRNTGHRARW